jgi:hypothetical protein
MTVAIVIFVLFLIILGTCAKDGKQSPYMKVIDKSPW